MALNNIELREIRTRNRKEHFAPENDSKRVHFLEHKVEQDDSLPKLSLTYGCTVSELKQANSIYNEKEFYARKMIRIPVHEHGILWEHIGKRSGSVILNVDKCNHLHLSNIEGSPRQSRENLLYSTEIKYDQKDDKSKDFSYSDGDGYQSADADLDGFSEKRPLLSEQSGTRMLNDASNIICEEYLDLVDKDIQHISKRVQSKTDIDDIGAHSLAYIQTDVAVSSDNEMLGHAGWFSYKGVIVVLCTVSVVLPLLYLLYFLFLRKNT